MIIIITCAHSAKVTFLPDSLNVFFVCKVKVYAVLVVIMPPVRGMGQPLILVLSQWFLVLSEIAKDLV